MNDITTKDFFEMCKKTIIDFDSLPSDDAKRDELFTNLSLLANNFNAYQLWSNKNHIFTSFTNKTISSKNINTYINSQIKHIEKSMDLCLFQYNGISSYYHLLALNFLFRMFLGDKVYLIDKLQELHFRYRTEPKYFDDSYSLLQEVFDNFFKIKEMLKSMHIDASVYCENQFADDIISMYKFFDAFNITEKRFKTSLSIELYNELKILALSKYKTKEITDTILNHLDIDASVNLNKIDKIHYIGSVSFKKIYSYDPPIIYTKILDRKLIQKIQQEKKEFALKNGNSEEVETLEKMIHLTNTSLFL